MALHLDYTTSLRWTIGFIFVLTAAYLTFRAILKKYFDELIKSLQILFFNDDITTYGTARTVVDQLLQQQHHHILKYHPVAAATAVIAEYMERMKQLDESVKTERFQ